MHNYMYYFFSYFSSGASLFSSLVVLTKKYTAIQSAES